MTDTPGDDPPGIEEPVNLFKNPGFEDVTGTPPAAIGWTVPSAYGKWGEGPISLTSEAARTGNYGVTINPVSGNTYIQQIVDVEAGKNYEISLWHKGTGQGRIKFEYIKWDEEKNKAAGNGEMTFPNFALSSEWQQTVLSAVMPEETIQVRVLLRYAPTTGIAHYDDVSIRLAED